jgi:hypothetical protein
LRIDQAEMLRRFMDENPYRKDASRFS